MSTELLNIMAVALDSDKRYKAYAVYDGERLAITHCLPVHGAVSTWRDSLLAEIGDKDAQGFSVLVEDRSLQYCVGDASPFSFDELIDGRSVLYHALDNYFSMLNLGNLIVDESVQRFIVRPGSEGAKIERKQDDKGRTIYLVDWNTFTGGHKAVLMCVCAATFRSLSHKFIDEVYGMTGIPEEEPHLKSWNEITKGYSKELIAKWSDYYEDGH